MGFLVYSGCLQGAYCVVKVVERYTDTRTGRQWVSSYISFLPDSIFPSHPCPNLADSQHIFCNWLNKWMHSDQIWDLFTCWWIAGGLSGLKVNRILSSFLKWSFEIDNFSYLVLMLNSFNVHYSPFVPRCLCFTIISSLSIPQICKAHSHQKEFPLPESSWTFKSPFVLASQQLAYYCCNKLPQTYRLKKTDIYYRTVLEVRSPKNQGIGRTFLLVPIGKNPFPGLSASRGHAHPPAHGWLPSPKPHSHHCASESHHRASSVLSHPIAFSPSAFSATWLSKTQTLLLLLVRSLGITLHLFCYSRKISPSQDL